MQLLPAIQQTQTAKHSLNELPHRPQEQRLKTNEPLGLLSQEAI